MLSLIVGSLEQRTHITHLTGNRKSSNTSEKPTRKYCTVLSVECPTVIIIWEVLKLVSPNSTQYLVDTISRIWRIFQISDTTSQARHWASRDTVLSYQVLSGLIINHHQDKGIPCQINASTLTRKRVCTTVLSAVTLLLQNWSLTNLLIVLPWWHSSAVLPRSWAPRRPPCRLLVRSLTASTDLLSSPVQSSLWNTSSQYEALQLPDCLLPPASCW